MKKCAYCKVEKPLKEFGIRVDAGDGLNYSCLACARKRNRKQQEKQRQEGVHHPQYIAFNVLFKATYRALIECEHSRGMSADCISLFSFVKAIEMTCDNSWGKANQDDIEAWKKEYNTHGGKHNALGDPETKPRERRIDKLIKHYNKVDAMIGLRKNAGFVDAEIKRLGI